MRRTGRKTVRAKGSYYGANKTMPVSSLRSALRASMIPAQETRTLRTTRRLGLELTSAVPTATGFYPLQSIATFDAQNTVFPGGFLPYMYIYDKAQVIKTRFRLRITCLGFTDPVAGRGVSQLAGSAEVVIAVTTCDVAQNLANNVNAFERLRDIPFSQFKALGCANSGHDSVYLNQSCDHERFIGAPLENSLAVQRDAPGANMILPNPNSPSMRPTPCIAFTLIPNRTPVENQVFSYIIEYEVDYTVLFTGVRAQTKQAEEITILTIQLAAQANQALAQENQTVSDSNPNWANFLST